MSDIVESIFQKKFYDINKDDLQNFFSEEQIENANLEFKSGQTDIIKIIKEVAAFLNTEGGLLILGAPHEIRKEKNKKVCKGELTASDFSNKDWVTQKISSNISPSPSSFRVHEIEIKNGKVFLIDIERSLTPPHQANDNGVYYIRVETESKPAPHGIVEALFNFRKQADLDGELTFKKLSQNNFSLQFSIRNKDLIPVEDVVIFLTIVGDLQVSENYENMKVYSSKNPRVTTTTIEGPNSLVLPFHFGGSIDFRTNEKFVKAMISFWAKDTKSRILAVEYDTEENEIVREANNYKEGDNDLLLELTGII